MRTILVIGAIALTAGCGGAAAEEGVVASFYPIAFAAQTIGGPDLQVRNLTPPGVEPHDVELTPGDAGDVERAGHLLYLGGGFQPAVERAAARRGGPSHDLLEGLPLEPGDEPGVSDPHVWLDPSLYERIALQIGDILERSDNAERFAARARALDAEFDRGLASCKRRTFVTSHDAFGYLARRYDLRQLGITGVDPEGEPSPQAIRRLIHLVERERIDTIFFESLVSPALARTVARATGARTAVLDPLEGLSAEAERAGDDYFTVMRRNLQALREALACQ
jgi:zinc transport system substrate-binding protein